MARLDPSQPLRSPRQEAYAFERGCGYPQAEACRRAGGDPRNGSATKWEAKPSVQARIAWWRRQGQSEAMLLAKRERIEDRLNLVAFGDILEFATVDGDGKVEIDWSKVKASPLAVIIAGLKFDKDTGKLVDFERDSALNALAQLRDMHGFKAVSKTALTDPTGNSPAQPFVVEIVKFGDAPAAAG